MWVLAFPLPCATALTLGRHQADGGLTRARPNKGMKKVLWLQQLQARVRSPRTTAPHPSLRFMHAGELITPAGHLVNEAEVRTHHRLEAQSNAERLCR